ncbi:MAG: hypothetical protein MJK04_26790, partial [Psychrosphaera sp.]|nr:hypothetical protein [Psychrosphaera sp.]
MKKHRYIKFLLEHFDLWLYWYSRGSNNKFLEKNMSVLVGRKAPDFTAAAVLGNGEIVDSFT